ncbi:MAG: RNA methyltransferase [Planctomycetes bacterium]|nr:RNA methyltransferase [Planctomycetota bacterium]
MSPDAVIRSRSNALIQRARAAVAGNDRDTLALEGDRLIDDAVRARHEIEVVLVAHDRPDRALELERLEQRVQLVDADLLTRLSSLETSPGIIALAPTPKSIDLAQLTLDARTLVLVVAGIADPGNLGALARAAEGLGATALVILAGGASPWNPKALRGSMGSLLRLPIAHGVGADECSRTLGARSVRQVCAQTRGGADPLRFDWKGPLALWIGPETGQMPAVSARFEAVTIPIRSDVESLNVTVAASILLFAAGRVARSARG